MSKKSWVGSALVLSLALTGSVWAQSQERGYGSGSGSYGSSQETGSGTKYGKPQTPPPGGKSESPLGICTPQSCPKDPKASPTKPYPVPEPSK